MYVILAFYNYGDGPELESVHIAATAENIDTICDAVAGDRYLRYKFEVYDASKLGANGKLDMHSVL